MLASRELRKIAKNTIKALRIGTKSNPRIEKARKKYGKLIDKILKMKKFDKNELSKRELAIIEKLKDPDYGPLIIERKGKFFVKTKIGETVRLVYSKVSEECKKLAEFIKEECWKKGAHVTDLTYSSAEARKHLKLIPFDTAAELPLTSKLFAGAYDVRIFLGGEEDINWAQGLEEKIRVGALASQKIREIIDRKKVRWCYFGWPIVKKQMFVSKAKYKKIFYKTIKETFSDRTRKLCKYYERVLKNGNKIKIVADDGTNLTFSIKGRPILVADGVIDENDLKRGDVGLNIPDGEVFVAPLEYSANGFIIFDFTTISGFGKVTNLKVKFKNGKIVWFDSPQKKIFKKFLESNTGEKDRIGEFGIGTNLAARYVGEVIIDEKIFGSIHIAIGSNRGIYKGKNKASSHLDMIKIMKDKNGKIFVDGKLIMEDGEPLR
jgi:leucyl aminopeptidase (aminopeptidase T)